MPVVISDLPSEILQNVALYLPRTADAFHLSLATRYLKTSLTDPVLFKRRLSYAGWDVQSWEEEDEDHGETEATGDVQRRSDRWMRIDYVHSRLYELFVEGSSTSAIGSFVAPSTDGQASDLYVFLSGIPSDDAAELGQKRLYQWLSDVGRLLPAVIVHHRKPIYSPCNSCPLSR